MPERRRPGLIAGACGVLTFAAFLPALRAPFLLSWDDGTNVSANAKLAFTPAGLDWMLTGSSLGHWHPLTWLSLALDRALWGAGPFGYHLTNVLLHALAAALLFLLARRLLAAGPRGGAAEPRGGAAGLGAAFAALAWSLHPLRVESVAWVSERRDVLCGVLCLGAALAWVAGAEAGEDAPGEARRRLALALGAAAMAAKVFAVVLPGVLLILDARLRARPRWSEKLPWLVPAALSLVFNAAAQARSGAAVSWAAFGLAPRLAQAAYALAFVPLKTLWPAGLSPLYERSLALEPGVFALAGLAAGALALAVFVVRRRSPAVAHAAAAAALLALPALGLFKSGRTAFADRYTYLPAMPLSVLAGAALARAASKPWARPAAAAVLLALAAATRAYLPVWSSETALWSRACAGSPLSYYARLRLAAAEASSGDAAASAADRAAAAALHREVFERAAALREARGDAAGAAALRARAAAGLELSQ